jgi:hypothetical protein
MEPQIDRLRGAQESPSPAPGETGPPNLLPPSPADFPSILIGDDGLRCGWSALLFVALYYGLTFVLDVIALSIDPHLAEITFSPTQTLMTELLPVTAILVAGLVMARVEHRRLVHYNLVDPRGTKHFLQGLVAGFVVLSALVFVLSLGGWLRFGPISLHGVAILRYGALWGCVFLLVGFFEEGSFRCYLLFTLTRGITFWWALATVSGLCLWLLAGHGFKGAEGVMAFAVLGVAPCWLVDRSRAASSSFWQAAWATSTAFGFFHTGNSGENAVGVFAASLVGFIFCISVRLTGSAWWAIGCHAAWDWAETFFYGTPDSGLLPQRHLLSTTPLGNALWSGGTDGPEGSLLILPILLLLLGALVLVYGRGRASSQTSKPSLPEQLSA